MPNSSSKELSEAQLAQNEFSAGLNHNIYRPLCIAAKIGDWKSAKSFIDCHPDALTARISFFSETVMHCAAKYCQWSFILKLLDQYDLSREFMAVQDTDGDTVLHNVARGGNLEIAKVLIQKNDELLNIVNDEGDPPLISSIMSKNKELVRYLTMRTRVESPSLPKVVRMLTETGFLDIALYFVQRYPHLALAIDDREHSLLHGLASVPTYFYSGTNLGFIERWIYNLVPVDTNFAPTHAVLIDMTNSPESTVGFAVPLGSSIQPKSFVTQVVRWFMRLKKLPESASAFAKQAPCIKKVCEAKLRHQCAVKLVNHICQQLSHITYQQVCDYFAKEHILHFAAKFGIEEIIRAILHDFPDQIFFAPFSQRDILQIAIEYRQENIFNIIKGMSKTIAEDLCSRFIESGHGRKVTTLHMLGKLPPPFTLYSVSGAALQMQRELQWFKEVENLVQPYQRLWEDGDHQTPKDVFRINHQELSKEGEKWMKNTANSCMVVSALVATVLFAAAFTVPGGNINDKGIPIFLQTNAFAVFAISNALGLFSSLTSLLMFLAILTSRYEQDDFLKSLPNKLMIGLGSLFFAIVTMIIAFGATLTVVLKERWQWVTVPITLLASFPVAVFVMLQLPLFIQMVLSTYGSGIFHP